MDTVKKIRLVSSLYILLFSLCVVNAKQIRIAVLDTGLNPTITTNKIKICEDGYHDFTGSGIMDTSGHGSNVSDIITNRLEKYDYCLYILKYHESGNPKKSLENLIKAYVWIRDNLSKINFINLSGGGNGFVSDEAKLVKQILDNRNIVWVVAAGNEDTDLDKLCDFMPACIDPRLIVVGNIQSNGKLFPSSNYGKVVDVYRVGVKVFGAGMYLSGTSQATAVYTNELLLKLFHKIK